MPFDGRKMKKLDQIASGQNPTTNKVAHTNGVS
jgi:hypothetical protein